MTTTVEEEEETAKESKKEAAEEEAKAEQTLQTPQTSALNTEKSGWKDLWRMTCMTDSKKTE